MLLRNWYYVVSIVSFCAISFALIAEYFFYLTPCSLCLKQRHPYYFILIIFVIFLLIKNYNNIWFFIGVQLASLYGLFYSIWHVGIEQKILKGPSSCTNTINFNNNTEKLKEEILSKKIINCEEVVWSIFGLSAATINSLLIFVILVINTIYLVKYYGSKKI